jgi:hypothetical protein
MSEEGEEEIPIVTNEIEMSMVVTENWQEKMVETIIINETHILQIEELTATLL